MRFFEHENTPKRLNKVEEFDVPMDLLLCGCAVSGALFFLLGMILGLFTGGI